jgi:hypothetical protein
VSVVDLDGVELGELSRYRAHVVPVPEGEAGADTACQGLPSNCAVLSQAADMHVERCERAGVTNRGELLSAAAVGLVVQVWRNSPVEEMHAIRRGPSDAAMFAESTALHEVALAALTADDRSTGLFDFEDHLLDRDRPWAGAGGRTLTDLGYGYLGAYRQHVKERINVLISLGRHTCTPDPLETVLLPSALSDGIDHKGMPAWPVIVQRIALLLADPDHPQWPNDRGHQALNQMPPQVTSVAELTAGLLIKPSAFPQEVLDWLSQHLLYCGGPPYRSAWAKTATR